MTREQKIEKANDVYAGAVNTARWAAEDLAASTDEAAWNDLFKILVTAHEARQKAAVERTAALAYAQDDEVLP